MNNQYPDPETEPSCPTIEEWEGWNDLEDVFYDEEERNAHNNY